MARTRSAGLKEHLVEAADELLDTLGPGTVTTRQIARHAAVSDGVLYNHFSDKDELLVAALVRRYGRLVEAFEARLSEADLAGEGSEPSLAGLKAWLRAFALALRDLEAGALHLAAGVLAEAGLLEAFWREMHRPPLGPDRLVRPLLDRLVAARVGGFLAQDLDVNAAVSLVFGASLMNAITLRVNARASREALDRELAAAIDLVAAALS